jgi:hypothetical protein
MRRIFLTIILILFFTLICLILILSTTGYETNKFNNIISNKISEKNKNFSFKFEKIKFRFDILNANLFLETREPQLNYQNLYLPIKNIKVYLNLISLIKSKPQIDQINIDTSEMSIDEFKKIIIKTKPSNLNSLIVNKVKEAKIKANLNLYFNQNFKIDNFIVRGEVKQMHAAISNSLIFKNMNFNFFSDKSNVLIKKINGEMDGVSIKDGNLQVIKEEGIMVKSDFLTDISINKKNLKNYLGHLKNNKFINKEIDFKAKLSHNLQITFDNTYKVINYFYKTKGKVDEVIFKPKQSIKNNLLNKNISSLVFKDNDFSAQFNKDEKNIIEASGSYRVNQDDYQKYNLKNTFLDEIFNIDVDLDFYQPLNIKAINYNKNEKKIANISSSLELKKNLINIKSLNYTENNNTILVENLKINKNKLASFNKIKIKTFKNSNLNNDFTINFEKKIIISGSKYDASNLSEILNQKSKGSFLKKISKDIDIDFKKIDTPISKKINNFKLIGSIKNGKFIKISSKGDFGNNKFLDISLKSDKKNKKKYLEIYSDLPQPLLTEYPFFKGLSDGQLIFNSIIEGDSSNSKLVINDFKIINAPAVIKLLSVADFGGLADLAGGEGLSFEKLEINMTQNKDFLQINELFALGPSVSVLMDGYKEGNGLTSLRGTIVPAKTLNKIISKIPVIGKIIIPKDVGEGLFGVSFKIKGMPGKMKTSVNPIKTLTPRFITKALEKSKKTK